MQSLTAAELLEVWERALAETPATRPVSLLSPVSGGASHEELARLPVGRRDALLLALRERTFGSRFACLADCPACGETLELEFTADEIRIPAAGEKNETLKVEHRGITIECRLPDSNDLAAIAQIEDAGVARRRLFEQCLLGASDAGGSEVRAAELGTEAIAVVAARMGEADWQADVRLDLACPACSHRWSAPFDIAGFLWTELKACAERLLSEVHELAAVYGWSESEIINLNPARRGVYLEMIRA